MKTLSIHHVVVRIVAVLYVVVMVSSFMLPGLSVDSVAHSAVYSAAPSASTSALMREATKEFLSGNFTKASALFSELLGRNLTYLQMRDVLVYLCESRLREGNVLAAESVAVLATQKLSDVQGLERISFLKGEILYFSGRIDEALEEYMTFVEVNPESPRVNDVIARLLLMDENSDRDRVPLRAFSYAQFLWFADMPDSALSVLDVLLASFPHALIADDALSTKGDILRAREDFVGAIAEYDSLKTRFPESHLVPVCQLKAAYVYARQLKDRDKAASRYEEVITEFPETSFAVKARRLLQELRK
ncbi:MAG: tetratricopeptide repeat protein [Candidatus Eiseniibacteriota bacterium]|nr:MAG: tetratricopeptide repeat protein [Candidatus Eisenbacteria bacterium]